MGSGRRGERGKNKDSRWSCRVYFLFLSSASPFSQHVVVVMAVSWAWISQEQ